LNGEATEPGRAPVAACLVCGSPSQATHKFRPEHLLRCTDCGLIFRDVGGQDVVAMYRDNSYAAARMNALTRHRRDESQQRVRWTAEQVSSGRLLDIGAGAGFFVEAAGARGFDAVGVEPSDLAATFARRELGVDVRTGVLETLGDQVGTFDIATMWHVLEHTSDPLALLRAVRGRLRDGGRLVLEVPNADSVGATVMKGRWAHLDPSAHICHFSLRSLRVALETAGFEVLILSTLLEGYYDTRAVRVRPRRIAGRLVRGARLRTLSLSHPSRGELLQAVARA
jgi:2-polyprenyl-3-methyl-5-hydroxy-6-metoxy-1,4-benzoquinol methylase